jgi:Recombination endonuclease VII
MSATDLPTEAGRLCGRWMPRKRVFCARSAGHPPPCASPQAMESQRRRTRAQQRVVAPEDKARWNRSHKFVRLGISQERFNEMLEAQGYACAMCGEPFREGDRIFADHDHTCCPKQVKATAKTCGRCVRGLLCFRCNTALGYIEKYGALARAYLDRVAATA